MCVPLFCVNGINALLPECFLFWLFMRTQRTGNKKEKEAICMRKGQKILFLAVLVVLVAGVTAVLLIPKSDTVELNLAHFFPSSHPVEKDLVQPWIEAVKEATGGRIQITSYPGETLAGAAEIYNGVVTGITDIGISCFSYTRGRFPVLEVFELPGITYLNSKVAGKVAWEGISELDPEEVSDTHLLMVFATGPGDLLTRVPIENLDDLQGKEIRATGLSAQTLEVLGAVPVAMPQPETYEALSRGIVQGNLSPLEVLQGWRHAEVTDYVTLTPFLYNTLFFMTMNLETWNALPTDLQETFAEVTAEYLEEVALGLWDGQNESALEWAVRETKEQIITLSEEETARWMELIVPIQENFAAKMAAIGVEGENVMSRVKEMAEYYNDLYSD